MAGDRDFCVDGEVEGRRGAEHHAKKRVAQLHPARGAQPVRLRLANAAHLFRRSRSALPFGCPRGRVGVEISSFTIKVVSTRLSGHVGRTMESARQARKLERTPPRGSM